MPEPFTHPVTYELLEATEPALQKAVTEADEALGRIYRQRDKLLERLAEIRGPAVLPRPSRQTDKQRVVSRCPRCGGRA